MASLNLDSAERQLIETLRNTRHGKLQLTIYRSSDDDWKIEMSFARQDREGRPAELNVSGVGSTFAEAWGQLVGG